MSEREDLSRDLDNDGFGRDEDYEWRPRKGDAVRALKNTEYFHKGEIYTVVEGRRGKMTGIKVRDHLGFAILCGYDSFEPVDSQPSEVRK